MNKLCMRCLQEKNTSEFYRDSARISGLSDWCKSCKKEWLAVYRTEFSERILTQQRKYKTEHKEAVLEITRIYKRNNPDKILSHNANRRALRLGQLVEKVDRQVVFARDKGICHICVESVDRGDWHLDHKIPLSKGGPHSYENTAVSHPFCNESKGDEIYG